MTELWLQGYSTTNRSTPVAEGGSNSTGKCGHYLDDRRRTPSMSEPSRVWTPYSQDGVTDRKFDSWIGGGQSSSLSQNIVDTALIMSDKRQFAPAQPEGITFGLSAWFPRSNFVRAYPPLLRLAAFLQLPAHLAHHPLLSFPSFTLYPPSLCACYSSLLIQVKCYPIAILSSKDVSFFYSARGLLCYKTFLNIITRPVQSLLTSVKI